MYIYIYQYKYKNIYIYIFIFILLCSHMYSYVHVLKPVLGPCQAGVHNIGALIITNTILGVPYCNYSILGP